MPQASYSERAVSVNQILEADNFKGKVRGSFSFFPFKDRETIKSKKMCEDSLSNYNPQFEI